MLYSLCYTSKQTAHYTRASYSQLLLTSSTLNKKSNLTGILLTSETEFCQVLEGAEAAIDETMVRIRRSPLHRDLVTHHAGTIETRMFPQWAMGGTSVQSLQRWSELFEKMHNTRREEIVPMQREMLARLEAFSRQPDPRTPVS